MSVPTILDDLTEPQRRAVTHREGALLVLAGPGSGKTTVVTRRVAHLIAGGVPGGAILALTFTNKAAGEMRERIEALLVGLGAPSSMAPTVSTFHSFCARLLRRYAEHAGLPPRFSIYDGGDQSDAIKQAIKSAELSSQNWTPSSMASHISSAKNRLLDAAGHAAQAGDYFSRQVAKVYAAYERLLREHDALDFDDLLMRTADLLRRDEEVRRRLQERYRYLLIDEYQDTNHAQFVIAHTLAAGHGNICVVGDPDQSIYGWRGADITNILEFEEHYPSAVVVPLGQNFRSTGHIVAAADGLIRHNRRRKHKDLHTDLGDGERPAAVTVSNEHREASAVADFLKAASEEGLPWREMSVLYRVNSLSRVLEESLRSAGIPYVIARGTAFYERREIKESLAYLRFLVNGRDEVSLRRILNTPPRGIGKTSEQKIELFAIDRQVPLWEAMRRVQEIGDMAPRAAAAVRKFVGVVEGLRRDAELPADLLAAASPLAGLVERVLRESGLEAMYAGSKSEEDAERLANLGELISAGAQHVPPPGDEAPRTTLDLLASFLESVALVSDADMIDPDRGSVTLLTLHAAKGLEFDVVAMIGLEEGLLPHARAAESDADLEEERRLCFVGITRARRRLLLTRAAQRTYRGMVEHTIPSRFLEELPAGAVSRTDQSAAEPLADRDDAWSRRAIGGDASTSAFPVGCIVRHPRFGLGRVEAILRRSSGSSARVAFPTAGTKTLILEYAPLQRVDQ